MRRSVVPALVGTVCVALLALLIYGVTQQGDGDSLASALAKGQKPVAAVAALPLVDHAGKSTLAAYRGRVVVVNFFASWCQPCADEAPLVLRTQKLLQKSGGTFLGVSWNDTDQNAADFLRKHGLDYPAIRDVTGSYAKAYGVKGMPESFVVNKQGRIVALSRGVMDETFVKQHIEPLLAPASQ